MQSIIVVYMCIYANETDTDLGRLTIQSAIRLQERHINRIQTALQQLLVCSVDVSLECRSIDRAALRSADGCTVECWTIEAGQRREWILVFYFSLSDRTTWLNQQERRL